MAHSPILDEKFRELCETAAPEAAISHLRRIIEEGDDIACYKINAFRFADDAGVSHVDGVRTLLFATKLGLLDLNYDAYCPSCHGLPDYSRALMGVKTRVHCKLCRVDIKVDFEDELEVSFTVNPAVRAISFKDFSDREEFFDRLAWIRTLNVREGRLPAMMGLFEPGETRTERATFAAGDYNARAPAHVHDGCALVVAGEPTSEVQSIRFAVDARGHVTPKAATLRPGPCDVTVEFGYPDLWGFAVAELKPRRNFVSAAYLTSQQDFRDLFSGEFLAPDVSFAIRSTTLMFTDIKGSTEMYEELGDAAAYRRVRDHFDVMTDVIRKNEGGIVKTIGDAVMASFPINVNAVRAACEIQLAFQEIDEPLRSVEVKIGLHRGPAIAVTTNRNLDFFGRTVNIAARVQGRSAPRQVLASESVLQDPDVGRLLSSMGLAPHRMETSLKGIAGAHTVHSIEPRRASHTP